jgi:hypothetical protein
MRGRKRSEGVQEMKGLARGGTRLPSGARSRPSQAVQVAGFKTAAALLGLFFVFYAFSVFSWRSSPARA